MRPLSPQGQFPTDVPKYPIMTKCLTNIFSQATYKSQYQSPFQSEISVNWEQEWTDNYKLSFLSNKTNST